MAAVLGLGLTPTVAVVVWTIVFIGTYSTETLDYSPLTFCHSAALYSNFGSNQLLSNALNKYHPFVLYMSFNLALFTYMSRVFSWGRCASFVGSMTDRFWSQTRWLVITVNLIALWMGSWWALQEGTWGGWWNWDSSEMFGLCVTLVFLTLTHSVYVPSQQLFFRLKFTALAALVLCSYVFMQINFELVSHNFGSKFFFFFNNNLFFLEIVVLSLSLTLGIYRTAILRRSLQSFHGVLKLKEIPFSIRSFVLVLPSIVGMFWLIWSFRPLISHFLWKFFEINALNSEGSLQIWHILSALLIFIMLAPKSYKETWLPLIALPYSPTWVWSLVFTLSTGSKFSILHFSLFLFTVLNISMTNSTLVSWLSIAPYSYLPFANRLEFQTAPLWILDTGIVETVNPWRSASDFTSLDWNQFGSTNSLALNFFSLELSHSTSRNLYILGETYSSILLDLEVPAIGSLNILFFVPLLLLF